MVDPQHHATIVDTSDAADAALRETAATSEHTVQFYEDESFLRETVARYLGAGLIDDESVVVIATESHRREFRDALVAKGIDVERACATGRLTFLDARATLDAFMVDGVPDPDRFISVIGRAIDACATDGALKRARLYGEMVDVLWRNGNPQAAMRLEELWNELGRARPCSLLCAYVMGNFFKEAHGEPFARICGAHDHVVPAESYSESDDREKRLREISLLQQRARALETELKRRNELEEALRSARERAEAASTAKDEFLAMLGHELRNPLSPILTALELMKLRGDGRISREQDVIDRQTRHLIRLVDDLLDVSRITRGKVELRKEAVQGRQASDRAEGGLGIGLALVRNLVTLHGGSVEARSPGLGKGSTFVVRLPALAVAPRAAAPAPTAFALLRSDAARRRVLIVDDNEDARMLLVDILEQAGHEVCAADSGPAALSVVEEFAPDVAVLDVGLPAMDGYELGSRLRALLGTRAPALIALTGYGHDADRVRSKASGFVAHLVKPLEASQLVTVIDRFAAPERATS